RLSPAILFGKVFAKIPPAHRARTARGQNQHRRCLTETATNVYKNSVINRGFLPAGEYARSRDQGGVRRRTGGDDVRVETAATVLEPQSRRVRQPRSGSTGSGDAV